MWNNKLRELQESTYNKLKAAILDVSLLRHRMQRSERRLEEMAEDLALVKKALRLYYKPANTKPARYGVYDPPKDEK